MLSMCLYILLYVWGAKMSTLSQLWKQSASKAVDVSNAKYLKVIYIIIYYANSCI